MIRIIIFLGFLIPLSISISIKKDMEQEADILVNSKWLQDNLEKVKIIDASYTFKSRPSNSEFKNKLSTSYARNDMDDPSYTNEHIPGAVSFNFDSAYFSSEFVKFDLYHPKVFQRYVRILGINNGDHIVVYSRGPAKGMMFASRVYWTFKIYGYDNISILNGGLDSWKSAGGKTTNESETPSVGNFEAHDFNLIILENFENIPFNNLNERNTAFLDARTENQFTGKEPLNVTFPGTKANGSHIAGSINFPMMNVIGNSGFKDEHELIEAFTKLELDSKKEIIVSCNTGIQASVLFVALRIARLTAKVYNGSMNELAYRAPQYVNETGP